MADAVYDDGVIGRLIEDQIRVRRDNHAPQARVAGQLAGVWMAQQQIGDYLNASLYMLGTLWRSRTDVIEHRLEFSRAAQGVAQLHR